VSLLASILESKRREVSSLRAQPRAAAGRVPLDVVAALARTPQGPLNLIAEVKLRSPSAGALSRALTPSERALAYVRAGAAMVSVLCDGPFFDGSWDHLEQARAALDVASIRVPLLAKEFVIDETQIREARRRGADAILLIARILPPGGALKDLCASARGNGLEPFVEVVDEAELEAALAAQARLIGVNARDLDTLAMDAPRTQRVMNRIPRTVVAVHLSGLREPGDVVEIARGRADAALIGEALMRDDDPEPRLRRLVAAASAPRKDGGG
jgi:indole-3-glycerol phosphate synthase